MRVPLFIMVILLFSSCGAEILSKQDASFQIITKDSILLQHLSARTKALNLPQINQGVDSFELRVWYGIAIASPNQLITFRYQKPNWTISKTDYWLSYDWENGSPTKILFDSSVSYSWQATSLAGEMINCVQEFRLDTFPNQKDIPGFDDKVADGTFYQIEIATPNYYKAVSYRNPFHYSDIYNQRMGKFIKGLNKIGVPVLL
jgi:hypothetical protein